MAWLADVAPQTTIRSVWGNTVRDRTIHAFASKAERDAVGAGAFADGMECYTAAETTYWVRRGGAWWPLWTPYRTYVPAMWVNIIGGDGTWHLIGPGGAGGTSVTVKLAQYTRSLEQVLGSFVVDFVWNGGSALVAISIPFAPEPYVSQPVGAGSLHDNTSGRDQGGVLSFAGPIGAYQAAAVPGASVTQPGAAGTIQGTLSYRTASPSEVAP